MSVIRHLVKKSVSSDEPLNLLCFPYDGVFERALCRTGHNIYCYLPASFDWHNFTDYLPPNLIHLNEINMFALDTVYDAIVCNDKINQYDNVMNVARSIHAPVIVVDHATFVEQLNPAHMTQIENKVSADTFVSSNQAVYDCWNKKGNLIPYGIEVPEEKEKDIDYLIVGKFTEKERKDIRNISKTLNAQVYGDNGELSKAIPMYLDFVDMFQRAKVFINLSVHTNLSIELLTAMACGCGIVTNKVGVFKDMLKHGENALIFDDLINTIPFAQSMMNNRNLRMQSAAINRSIIEEQFKVNCFDEKWSKVLHDIKDKIFIL